MQKLAPLNKTICLVAGGSGGHITPALRLGKQHLEQTPHGSLLFFCNTRKLDQAILANYDQPIQIVRLKLTNLPGKKIWRYPLFFLQFAHSFFKSFHFLKKQKPCVIISTGGIIAIPVCLAGKLLSIPVELHEFNVIPGKATRFLSPVAKKIFISFQKSTKFFKSKYQNKCSLEKYPLRFSVHDTTSPITRPPHFSSGRKTIFLLGGSQGSLLLNNMIKEFIQTNQYIGSIQVIHQTGSIDQTNWKKFYEQHNIPAHIFEYTNSIKDFYRLADLVICRAGAGTLFELEFFQKRSLLVPLKNHASNHQITNAHEMCQRHPNLFFLCDQDSQNPLRSVIYDHLLSNLVE
ncbi:UDP-N-acetylglucosamine--N-acetylmuramyl-(pentapeptide) pyrophosphoryl-undecaprenol N-acetylglucosamine transferase [Candidatus Dependentiae bacterium]|nr:UDP-N-acetylglucosamine--N-acetylmuramyl-(pentapeptide) pyrophosphoryl-undecaprenol N-acetylglucosamine transferase [Candidatus Dependentiae bacterium]